MRVKRGPSTRKKKKTVAKANKGYKLSKGKLTKAAKEAYLHAGEYAYAGRKQRKRQFRRLWITRISETVKQNGISYSQFIHKLKAANIEIDRKILANLIVENPDAFAAILEKAKNVN